MMQTNVVSSVVRLFEETAVALLGLLLGLYTQCSPLATVLGYCQFLFHLLLFGLNHFLCLWLLLLLLRLFLWYKSRYVLLAIPKCIQRALCHSLLHSFPHIQIALWSVDLAIRLVVGIVICCFVEI
jgi:hypothetical protein